MGLRGWEGGGEGILWVLINTPDLYRLINITEHTHTQGRAARSGRAKTASCAPYSRDHPPPSRVGGPSWRTRRRSSRKQEVPFPGPPILRHNPPHHPSLPLHPGIAWLVNTLTMNAQKLLYSHLHVRFRLTVNV